MSGFKKNSKVWSGPSNSEQYLQSKSQVPQVSALMAQTVSQSRRDALSNEVEQGLFRDGSTVSKEGSATQNSNVVASVGFKKVGQVVSGGGGGFRGGTGDTVKQTPEVYSPLWLNSNLNLPRDRATINAWCRSFYALNPFVHNAINLHSTYPISKLNIKCPNKEIEKFYNDMIEEIDLMNICVQIAQEFWLLGESFVYAELDEGKGKWSRLLIQNPDYMVVKRTVVANEPIIMLRPDENLKKIVFSNKPADIEQRKQLNEHIIDSVKRGDNIPIDNFHISHLARRISPYEIRGTGLPVCVFRQLMLFDKLRECYDEETEVLTDLGFKRISQLLDFPKEIKPKLKDIKIACVDPNTNKVFYKSPNKIEPVDYQGSLYSFNGKKVDLSVLPSSFLWAKEKTNNIWSEYKKIPAQQFINNKKNYKFNCKVDFDNNYTVETVDVCGHLVPIKLYLKVLGYLISEGCIYSNFTNKRYDAFISVNQLTSSDCFEDMRQSFDEFSKIINKKSNNYIKSRGNGYSKKYPKEMWNTSIHGKDIVNFFAQEIGDNGNTKSNAKRIPRWALNLNKELSEILLLALVKGDGTEGISKFGTGSKNFKYSTISKQLADDVYELVYKCGYVPNLCISTAKKSDHRTVTEYIVMWSDTVYGDEPNVFTIEKTGNNGGGAHFNNTYYQGKLWNVDLNELMITRRNGKISIQYVNCYDDQVEVLTDFGFKKFSQLLETSINPNYVNGVTVEDKQVSSIVSMKEDFKVACINPNTNTIEYHKPIELHMSHYQGEMIHFKSKNIDSLVSPNHKMWAQKKGMKHGVPYWSSFEKIKAQEISSKTTYRFEAVSNWEGENLQFVNVLNKQVPIELYLKFIGYVLSEGYLGQNYIDFTQKIDSDCINDIKDTVLQFAAIFNLSVYEREIVTKDYKKLGFKKQPSNRWNARINSKELMNYFINEIGGEKSTSAYKKIPTWIKSLNKNLLSILLETLVLGDGSHLKNKRSLAWKYYTISKQLADDVQEIVFKCGFAPSISTRLLKSKNNEYCVSWSNAADGNYPILTPNNKYPSKINKENYNGVVWCFEVPTGLFVTRRNGKIAIHGNSKYAQADNMINPLTLVKIGSADFKPTFADLEAWRNIFEEAQYDKDFKIFTHEGVAVERVGYNSGLVDISNDITQTIKEIYIGLQVPSVLMDGGADTTYANGGVALDVLRQRYMQFRNMMSAWLKRKIFAPISKIQNFYDYSHGEKQLIIPEIDWNHMSLFDAGDYINNLVTLTQGEGEQKRASLHTLYRSLGLEFSDEVRKLRKESIQAEIFKKEKATLAVMDLNALRSLDEEDEISEPKKEVPPGGEAAAGGAAPPPLPGETPGGAGEPPALPSLPP